ncbi:MAG: hypothetical protein IKY02_01970, partial [Lachnospiraceae bacterium]|nr:hypothetical protein [Lachnospiraceae bacterium]
MTINIGEDLLRLLEELFGFLSRSELQILLSFVLSAAGIVVLILWAVAIAYIVLQIAAVWKMFRAAGEGGWKVLIPFYGQYTMYKITWNKGIFWVILILTVSGALLTGIGTAIIGVGAASVINSASLFNPNAFLKAIGNNSGAIIAGTIVIGLGCLVSAAVWVIELIAKYHISKAFNHGFGYFLGLVFFNEIFMLIIGFDSGLTYVGNAADRKAAKRGKKAAPAPTPVTVQTETVPMIHEVYPSNETTIAPAPAEAAQTVEETVQEAKKAAQEFAAETGVFAAAAENTVTETAAEVQNTAAETVEAVQETVTET